MTSRLPTFLALAAVAAGGAAEAAAPPVGYYECYFHGTYGLQNSSLTEMRVLQGDRYQALGKSGGFSLEQGTKLRMLDGALAGRVAHVRQSSGKPAIVFLRKENEVNGRPTIDISDTWCYHEPR